MFNLNEPIGLQSIEVLRGAGSDALGGTVNLVSKNNYSAGDKPEFHGEFSPVFDTSDRSFGGSTILSYETNRLTALGNISARRVNTLRTAGGIVTH